MSELQGRVNESGELKVVTGYDYDRNRMGMVVRVTQSILGMRRKCNEDVGQYDILLLLQDMGATLQDVIRFLDAEGLVEDETPEATLRYLIEA